MIRFKLKPIISIYHTSLETNITLCEAQSSEHVLHLSGKQLVPAASIVFHGI